MKRQCGIFSGTTVHLAIGDVDSKVGTAWEYMYSKIITHFGGCAKTGPPHSMADTRIVCVVRPPSLAGSRSDFGNCTVVSSEWIDACVKAKEKLSTESFLVNTENQPKEVQRIVNFDELGERERKTVKRRKLEDGEDAIEGFINVRGVKVSSQYTGLERAQWEEVCSRCIGDNVDAIGVQHPELILCKDQTAQEWRGEGETQDNIVVSEWYIFHCHQSQKILPVVGTTNIVSRLRSLVFVPPKSQNGVDEMQHLIFSSTGFDDDVLRRDVRHAVILLGALYLPHLATNLTTHLICAENVEFEPTDKFKKANKTSVQLVSLEWLNECLSRWEYIPESRQLYSAQSVYSSQKSEPIDFYATQISQFSPHENGQNIPPTPPKEKCFLLGSFKGSYEEVASNIEETIMKLGGTLVQSVSGFDFSHFVVPPEPQKRTEKMLCAIAAGKFIVTSTYIEESLKANAFLPEEKYLFGDSSLPQEVLRRWQNCEKPFKDMRAVVCHSVLNPPPDVICRVVEAGGGKAAIADTAEAIELFTTALPTVCFSGEVTIEFLKQSKTLSAYLDNNIPFVLPMWLLDFLTKLEVAMDSYQCFPSR